VHEIRRAVDCKLVRTDFRRSVTKALLGTLDTKRGDDYFIERLQVCEHLNIDNRSSAYRYLLHFITDKGKHKYGVFILDLQCVSAIDIGGSTGRGAFNNDVDAGKTLPGFVGDLTRYT